MNEMIKLQMVLRTLDIPFEVVKVWGNDAVKYPSNAKCVYSVVYHAGSTGYDNGLIEMLDVAESDAVGNLTAEQVASKIISHHLNSSK